MLPYSQDFINSYFLVKGIDLIFKTKKNATIDKEDWEFLKNNLKSSIKKNFTELEKSKNAS